MIKNIDVSFAVCSKTLGSFFFICDSKEHRGKMHFDSVLQNFQNSKEKIFENLSSFIVYTNYQLLIHLDFKLKKSMTRLQIVVIVGFN